MKKRTKIIAGVVALALIGGGIMFNNNYQTNGNLFDFTSREDRQLAYLKEHEQEIIDFVKAQNPKIESVQIDWDSMEVVELNAGLAKNPGYNLSLKGMFNNLANTEFTVDFYIENSSDIPIISKIGMLNHPSILKDGVWIDYE